MGWVKQRTANKHICVTPIYASGRPIGSYNDLWRCDDCSQLWRVGLACAYCNQHGDRPHNGQHEVGYKWRHASWMQQLLYRNR